MYQSNHNNRFKTLCLLYFFLSLNNNIAALTFSHYSKVLVINMMLGGNNLRIFAFKILPTLHSRMHAFTIRKSYHHCMSPRVMNVYDGIFSNKKKLSCLNSKISKMENVIQRTTFVSYTFPLYCSNKVKSDALEIDYDESNKIETTEKDFQSNRITALHEQIKIISSSIDPNALALASHKALTTTEGYDPEYGKPALRAYRTFLKYPPSNPNEDVTIAATRTARQIDFLVKRHKSRSLEWVRHTDEEAKKRSVFPLSLILDNVRSAFNVGSIFRTADACGCMEVITTGITPHPDGSGREKLSKCALGADSIVPTRHFSTTMEAIQTLRNEDDVILVGMETTDRSLIYTDKNIIYPKHGKGTYLILGNEVSGIDTEIIDMLDIIVEIPMFGGKNSLNIAACAPVVMYEILRQWGILDNSNKETGKDIESI